MYRLFPFVNLFYLSAPEPTREGGVRPNPRASYELYFLPSPGQELFLVEIGRGVQSAEKAY